MKASQSFPPLTKHAYKHIKKYHILFMVPVTDDSMEHTYHNEDVLIVEKDTGMEPGEIGVFTLNGRVIGVLDPEWIMEG